MGSRRATHTVQHSNNYRDLYPHSHPISISLPHIDIPIVTPHVYTTGTYHMVPHAGLAASPPHREESAWPCSHGEGARESPQADLGASGCLPHPLLVETAGKVTPPGPSRDLRALPLSRRKTYASLGLAVQFASAHPSHAQYDSNCTKSPARVKTGFLEMSSRFRRQECHK